MSIKKLLTEVSVLSDKNDKSKKAKGTDFNIFEVLSVQTDEVKICRVLHELLNPKGSHGKGDLYLKYFIVDVLKIQNFTYNDVVVHREYLLSNLRRIDIVIENGTYFIPIEVKINAEDQEAQCYDYYQVAKNSNVYYLTKYGYSPTDFSAKGLTYNGSGYDEVTEISFERDILDWLVKCLNHNETQKSIAVKVAIEQLTETVRKITNQEFKEKYMDIEKLIISSPENIKSAFEIENSLKLSKINLLNKVFMTLEKKLKEKGMQKIDLWDYDGSRINNFYDGNSKRPGLSYLIEKDIKPNINLVFRIEIDENIYCGFCTPLHNERKGKQIDDVKDLITVSPRFDDWWIYSEYLPIDGVENSINFRYPNIDEKGNSYFGLYDTVKFDLFIDTCMVRIEEILKFVK